MSDPATAAAPGLPWAAVSVRAPDVHAFREECRDAGVPRSGVRGDAATCLFATVQDPDGGTVLVVDR